MPVILGGDHSVPFGAIRAYAETYPGLGILHLDAHADLRDAYEGFTWSHASIFHNVMTKIDGVGGSCRSASATSATPSRDDRRVERPHRHVLRFRRRRAQGRRRDRWPRSPTRSSRALPDDVYLSWDIDGLDPTLCPAHRDAGARRPVVERGDRPAARHPPREASGSSVSISARSRRARRSGTRTSARGCCTR